MTKSALAALASMACLVAVSVHSQKPLPPSQKAALFESAQAKARTAMMTDPRRGLALAQAAGRLADGIGDVEQRRLAQATSLWLQAEAVLRRADFERARSLLTHATALLRGVRPSRKALELKADILVASGSINGELANAGRSLADFQEAYALFGKLHDTRKQAITLISIAVIYSQANDNAAALRYISQALELHSSDRDLTLALYNNRGGILIAQGRARDALEQFNQALSLARGLSSDSVEARILRNMVRAQLVDGQIAAAERTSRAAMAAAIRAGREEELATISAVAQLALQQGRLAEARALIGRTFDGVDLKRTAMPMREAHLTAYKVHRASEATAESLAHLEALKRLDDEAAKLATQTNIALMGARFDFANQELRIARLKADELRRTVAFEQERARTQQRVFAGASAIALMVLGLLTFGLFALRRSRDRTQALADDLTVTNDALGLALRAKTEFLATTSHEIRTPLNGILGMTQVMLADRGLADATRDRVRLVHGAGVTMRALVDDILDTAKIERGKLTIEHAPFNLEPLLRDAARLWEDQIRAKGVALAVDIDLPAATLVGDAARVRQVVFNLLSNAAKFTAAGTVRLSASRSPDGAYRVSVGDTGVGVAPDKLEHIFESFAQGDASTTRRFGGTGLGLSISRNLARAMGGDLTASSVPGLGSTFTVTIPFAEAPAPAAEEAGAGPRTCCWWWSARRSRARCCGRCWPRMWSGSSPSRPRRRRSPRSRRTGRARCWSTTAPCPATNSERWSMRRRRSARA